MIETKKTDMNFTSKDSGKDRYLADFSDLEKNLNGEASSSLHKIRKDALSRFADLGFPTTKHEEWKYTDVKPLTQRHFNPVRSGSAVGLKTSDIKRFNLNIPKAHILVCVNGHYSKELSSVGKLPGGVKMGSIADAVKHDAGLVERHLALYAKYGDDAFTALSTAFLVDGLFVHIPDGVVLDTPIHLMFVSTGETEFVSYPRALIVAGKSSQAALVESHVHLSAKTYFTNVVVEAALGENAVVELDKVQQDSLEAFHVSSMHVHQQRNSNFISNAITFGGGFVRNNIMAVLDGEGAEATINGLYLGTGSQHIDNHTTIDHAKPHCPSHELYKGILAGKSKGVFNGKILVRKDAQKTDAKQTNKNLVLSDEASIDTKPQLEIFANDVKCTHGATIGQLDEEALFYLRSRGIGVDKARDILIYAFASDVVNKIKIQEMREELQKILHDRLEQSRVFAKETSTK